MQNLQHLTPDTRQPSQAPKSEPTPRSDPNWKPQPCGLTREELRKIVEEILG